MPEVPGHRMGISGQVPLLHGGTGSVLLSKDHFSKVLAVPHSKTNNFNICLGCIQFSSVSLCGLNKLLPSCSEEELMIYGPTGTTLQNSNFSAWSRI